MIQILCAWPLSLTHTICIENIVCISFIASVICSLSSNEETYAPLFAVEVFLSFPSHYQAAVVDYLGSVHWSQWPSLGCLH